MLRLPGGCFGGSEPGRRRKGQPGGWGVGVGLDEVDLLGGSPRVPGRAEQLDADGQPVEAMENGGVDAAAVGGRG